MEQAYYDRPSNLKTDLTDDVIKVCEEVKIGKKGFVRYPHLEKLIHDDVAGILEGRVHVFPKIDGTNGSVWRDGDTLRAGSRNRVLTVEENSENDNAGFASYIYEHRAKFERIFDQWPTARLYGEWLVPHTLKTYRDDAWRKFYVFDVWTPEQGFIEYETYKPLLAEALVDFIPCATAIKYPTEEQLLHELNKNTYLIDDGKGVGEGIVLKRYGFVNVYGRTTWGKIVRTEFKDKHVAESDPNEIGAIVPEAQVADYADWVSLCSKVWANIKLEKGGWKSQYIPELLGRVWHDFFAEELWMGVKKANFPTVNFKRLQRIVADRTKKALPEVF